MRPIADEPPAAAAVLSRPQGPPGPAWPAGVAPPSTDHQDVALPAGPHDRTAPGEIRRDRLKFFAFGINTS
jgi:hypothetical protein